MLLFKSEVTRVLDQFMDFFIPSLIEVLSAKVSQIFKVMTSPIVPQTVQMTHKVLFMLNLRGTNC